MSTSVASVVSHFPDAENGFTTTASGAVGSGAATVGLAAVGGYTNGQPVVLVIDPTDAAKKQTFTGIMDTAGLQVTDVIWTAGTNQAHDLGATIVDYATATHIAMISKGIQVDHKQAGYHKSLTDANGLEWIKQTATASAVNEVTIANAATGGAPTISATGDNTDVGLTITTKAAGDLTLTSPTGLVLCNGLPPKTFADEATFDYVASGCVWSADAVGTTLDGSMTAGVVYIDGVRVVVALITAHAFTASKDTYIDVGANGTVDYTEVANNAASPALSASHIRLGIIVTDGTDIHAVGSINQGEENKVLPIAASIAYSVTDSLGNLICPRDANRRILGYRQSLTSFTTNSGTSVQITGLTCPVIVPTGRKVKITVNIPFSSESSAGATNVETSIWDGVVDVGTSLTYYQVTSAGANYGNGACLTAETTPAAASKTYNAGATMIGGTLGSWIAAANAPLSIMVELV